MERSNKLLLSTSLGALWDTEEHHFKQGYKISQCIMDYIVGEYSHKVEDIYNIPSTYIWANISSQQDFGTTFEGIQPEAFEGLG